MHKILILLLLSGCVDADGTVYTEIDTDTTVYICWPDDDAGLDDDSH